MGTSHTPGITPRDHLPVHSPVGGDDFWDKSVRLGTDFWAGAELLIVDVLVACTRRRLPVLWGGIGRAGGPGWGRGKSRAPGRVQVWELHLENHSCGLQDCREN